MSDSQPMNGLLIAFEGLDQSGKQTQAERLRDQLTRAGASAGCCRFPTTTTPIGAGDRDARSTASATTAPTSCSCCTSPTATSAKPRSTRWLAEGLMLVCDRYVASSIAYGEAQGLDPRWLATSSDSCRRRPDHPARHRARDRGAAQGGRPRSLRARPGAAVAGARQLPAAGGGTGGWLRLDGERPRDAVSADVLSAVATRLAPP